MVIVWLTIIRSFSIWNSPKARNLCTILTYIYQLHIIPGDSAESQRDILQMLMWIDSLTDHATDTTTLQRFNQRTQSDAVC